MTSSMSVELTPGQRCLLDLLQRKLLKTIQSYAKLSIESQNSPNCDNLEAGRLKLKEKIRRISARQKRFTLEIINGNGNNTIPKESFFEALGLVTKEALNKLNSKTSERRRRTTANPRFSHEAIQAKRALEPLQKRLESRVRESKRETSSKKSQRHQSNNPDHANSGATNSSDRINNNNNNNATTNNNGSKGNNQQALNNATRSSNRSGSGRNRNLIIHNERQELLNQFGNLQQQIRTKVSQIKEKQASNKRLEKQNELIRKRGLDIMNAINMINPNQTLQETQLSSAEQTDNLHKNNGQSEPMTQLSEPLDSWFDMKCDESLDGLE